MRTLLPRPQRQLAAAGPLPAAHPIWHNGSALGSSPELPSLARFVLNTSQRRRAWFLVIQLAMFLGVAAVLYFQVSDRLDQIGGDLARANWAWLALAGGLYLLGLLPMGLFWRQVLAALGPAPGFLEALRAYYIGHLGKYVPSKALVIVLRVWCLHTPVNRVTAAVSVVYENFVMMAVGGLLGAVLLLVSFRVHYTLLAVAIGTAVLMGIPILPPIFRRIAIAARLAKADPQVLERLAEFDAKRLALGALGVLGGWCILGLSLWAVLMAFVPEETNLAAHGTLYIAAVALSLVAGFASLLPGGAGVRELALVELLKPHFSDPAIPVTAAVLLRLIWLLAEVVISVIVYPAGWAFAKPPAVEAAPPAE